MGRQPSIVVIGAGQAGFHSATSLRDEGFRGRIVLLSNEPGLPYRRPPLAKDYLFNGETFDSAIILRPDAFYKRRNIELKRGTAVYIDRDHRKVFLESGESVSYDYLILALGARNRTFPIPGANLPGVYALRTHADAERLRPAFETAETIVSIGAGLLGMEVISTASSLGKSTVVIDPRERVMARSLSKHTSEHFTHLHSSNGTAFHLRQQCSTLHSGPDGKIERVELADTTMLEADLVVLCVGVVPNSELAAAAGLAVNDGVLVDLFLRTSDPAIFAIGDCARFPSGRHGRTTRLESIQNAVDQARHVATTLIGSSEPYRAVPLLRTEQLGTELQVAGPPSRYNTTIRLGGTDSSSFSVLLFHDGELIRVESVNRPADHMSARRLLSSNRQLTPETAAVKNFDLEAHVQSMLVGSLFGIG